MREVVADASVQRHLDALRVRNGEPVRLYNGRGDVANAKVERRTNEVILRVDSLVHYERPAPVRLAIGLLDHRDRMEFAIEKAVELGVTHVYPLASDHVQFPRWNAERAQAKVLAALTQCGQPWLPEISEPMSVEDLLRDLPENETILVGDPQGSGMLAVHTATGITCCVGPEGGFSQRELEILLSDHRTTQIAIGRFRLRAETAGVAMLASCAALRTGSRED